MYEWPYIYFEHNGSMNAASYEWFSLLHVPALDLRSHPGLFLTQDPFLFLSLHDVSLKSSTTQVVVRVS